ncbi:MAG TPA: hypothetical protein ENK76_02605 [Campylobacterales bacterium]|nr:hypothetical protein [Campylobacterales bacterium]
MFYQEILKKPVKYYDSSLIALILSLITIPSFWYISSGNLSWVLSCTILWAVGVFTIFQPMVRYIFPYLLTQIGTVSLTFILAIVSIFLNTTMILILLPQEDVEILLNTTIFSSSISNIFIFMWFYILIAGTLLSNLDFHIKELYAKPKQLIYTLTNNPIISDSFIEMILIFISPIALLFWSDITYSFRVLLGILSIGIGLTLFIYKIIINNTQNKIYSIATTSSIVLIVNAIIIGSIGIDRIPDTNIKARISGDQVLLDLEAKNIKYPSFQLSNNRGNGTTTIYQVLASIPQIGLHIGHRVGTIHNQDITIEAKKSQYTISDQYNNKRLISLDR